MAQPTAIPVSSSKGKNSLQDGATASLTPSSPPKESGEPPVDSNYRVVNPQNPSTSTARGCHEDIDLTGIEENTLTADFQVGRHVSLFPSLHFFVGCAISTPDGSSPRVYVWLHAVEHRLKLVPFTKFHSPCFL